MAAPSGDTRADTYCPRCRASGAVLFRSLRSSAVYLCRDCDHQWEDDRAGASPLPLPEPVRSDTRP